MQNALYYANAGNDRCLAEWLQRANIQKTTFFQFEDAVTDTGNQNIAACQVFTGRRSS
jgi:hypothetical protein